MTFQIEGIYPQSYLNLLSSVMNQLKIPQTIDRLVPYDSQCLTTPGQMVKLLVLDILSGRQALVHLESWAQEIDLEKLISPDVQARYFNDDAISRHLDRIHEANVHRIFSEITLETYRTEKLSPRVLHGDTTSKSLYGAYPPSEDETELQITEGYSRDRPGAVQFQYGVSSNEYGIPFYADVHNGNTSDKKWNPDVLKKLKDQFEKVDLDSFIYVADSAAMSQKTLDQAKESKAYLITRGPNQLKIVKEALKCADEQPDCWTEPFQTSKQKNSAVYRVQEQSATYYGHDVRLVVVESSALHKTKQHTLEKQRMKEYELIHNEKKKFEKQPFHCQQDAEKGRDEWLKDHNFAYYKMESTILTKMVEKRRRGRPRKGEQPEETVVYTLQLEPKFDEQAFETACRKASRFVLVTTVPKTYQDLPMEDKEILRMYKGQISVEMNFSFLKDPYFVDEIYLKKPNRVKVLGYLFLIALVVYRVFQQRIRTRASESKPLIGAGKRKLLHPTGQVIFQMFQYVQVVMIRLPDGTKQRQFGKPLTYEQKKVLSFLEMEESVYL